LNPGDGERPASRQQRSTSWPPHLHTRLATAAGRAGRGRGEACWPGWCVRVWWIRRPRSGVIGRLGEAEHRSIGAVLNGNAARKHCFVLSSLS
jgi:hypothetical protein